MRTRPAAESEPETSAASVARSGPSLMKGPATKKPCVRPISTPRSSGETPVRYAGRLDRKLATWAQGRAAGCVSAGAGGGLRIFLVSLAPAAWARTRGDEVTGVSNMPMKGSPLIALTTSFCAGGRVAFRFPISGWRCAPAPRRPASQATHLGLGRGAHGHSGGAHGNGPASGGASASLSPNRKAGPRAARRAAAAHRAGSGARPATLPNTLERAAAVRCEPEESVSQTVPKQQTVAPRGAGAAPRAPGQPAPEPATRSSSSQPCRLSG